MHFTRVSVYYMYKCECRKTEARFALLLQRVARCFYTEILAFYHTNVYSFRAAPDIILPTKNTHTIKRKKSIHNIERKINEFREPPRPLCDRVTKPEQAKSMMAFN